MRRYFVKRLKAEIAAVEGQLGFYHRVVVWVDSEQKRQERPVDSGFSGLA